MDQRPDFPALQRKEGLEVGGSPQAWHKKLDSHLHPGLWHHTTPVLQSRSLVCDVPALHSHTSLLCVCPGASNCSTSHTASAALALGTSLKRPMALKGLPERVKRKRTTAPGDSAPEKRNDPAWRRVQGEPEGGCAPKVVT